MNSRKRTTGIRLALAIALVAVTAFAVHDKDFELDGNIINDSTNSQPVDWTSLFNVSGNNVPTPKATLPTGFFLASFVRDFAPGGTSDSTTYATGSKDLQNISGGGTTNGDWQCAKSNNVNDKTDLLNGYAAAFRATNGDLIVYFGAETASNEGTRDVGFWFLKDGSASCTAGAHATDFTGNHSDGDFLVVAEYTGSSGVSTVKAFRWNGDATTGSLGVNAVATGADCRNAGANDNICARTNSSPILHSNGGVPWLTQTKTSNPSIPTLATADLDIGEFFEGGINLTALGLEGCFATFAPDTRSSATPTATLFDFAIGSFPLCSLSVDKACVIREGNPHLLADGDTIETEFDVPITLSGSGTIYDVRLKEDFSNLPTTATAACRITAVTGGDPAITPPVALGSTPVKVYNSLTGTGNVTVVCDTTGVNPFVNTVAADAKSSQGLSSQDLSASHTTGQNQTCSPPIVDRLTPDKKCKSVTIDPSTLTPIVCVDITVTNNSNEDVFGITVSDNKIQTVHLDKTALEPGESAKATECYAPTAADGVHVDPIDPTQVAFTDQLTRVTGTGAVSGATIDLVNCTAPNTPPGCVTLPSATCKLCPPPQTPCSP